jgi:hypothetical protein
MIDIARSVKLLIVIYVITGMASSRGKARYLSLVIFLELDKILESGIESDVIRTSYFILVYSINLR